MRADVVARAMRLIADGEVERSGVPGLAARLGYSERQLHRLLVGELGVGPLALARAQRAQTARLLLETTDLPVADVAFAAGFASIRQFNDTVREVFATTPTGLRRSRTAPAAGSPGTLTLRLAARAPFDAPEVLLFLGAHAVPGLEEWDGTTFTRVLDLPHGPAVVALSPAPDGAPRRGRPPVAGRAARPGRGGEPLPAAARPGRRPRGGRRRARPPTPRSRPWSSAAPGRRVPASPDAAELAVRAVLGQQVSVAGARTLTARLLTAAGTPLPEPVGTPHPRLPAAGGAGRGRPRRGRAHRRPPAHRAPRWPPRWPTAGCSWTPAPTAPRPSGRCWPLPGIGPWTAALVALRGLGDPDVWLPGDLALRRSLEAIGSSDTEAATRWRPWRSYAVLHLWSLAAPSALHPPPRPRSERPMTPQPARYATVATPPRPVHRPGQPRPGRPTAGTSSSPAAGPTTSTDLLRGHPPRAPPGLGRAAPTAAGPGRGHRLLRRRGDAIDASPSGSAPGPSSTGAWEVLRTVPAGQPETYAEFAARCGRPTAVRAAANACARNAAALFVPCHRVHSSGGGLGGFRWSTPVKRWLLDHEAAHAAVGV